MSVSRRRLLKSAGGLLLGAALAKVEMADALGRNARQKALARWRSRRGTTPVATPAPIITPPTTPTQPPVITPAVGVPLVRSTWSPFVSSSFQMTGPGGNTSAVLQQVADLPWAAAGDENRFSLLFSAPTASAMPQGIYQLQSGVLSTALFVVPVEQVTTARHYEAVINRI